MTSPIDKIRSPLMARPEPTDVRQPSAHMKESIGTTGPVIKTSK
jgi:hypothetical protein